MKVGDYVRIRWGNGLQTISKCKNIIDMGDTQYAKDDFYIHTDHSGEVIYKTMIVKSSPNIIDLIEVGDFVNGIYIDTVEKEQKRVWHTSSYGDDDIVFYDNDIQTIVTKEQFNSMEYKVGE